VQLKLKVFGSLCTTAVFEINGITADESEFGHGKDISPHSAEPYCCGYREWTASLPDQEVLDKYKITVDEYRQICDQLEEGLSFGPCGMCS